MQDTKISIEQYQEMIQVQKQENEILFNKQLEYEDEIRALQNKSKIQEQQLLINQSTLGKTLTGNNPNPSYFSSNYTFIYKYIYFIIYICMYVCMYFF